MSKESLYLARGYLSKAVNRLQYAHPNEILPLIKIGITRLLFDMQSAKPKQMIRLLQDYYARNFPNKEAPVISSFMSNNNGYENETYSFTVVWGPANYRKTEEMILCIYPGANAHKRSNIEYQALTRLHEAGYPVPNVEIYDQNGDELSLCRPFAIMKRINGCRMWNSLINSKGEVDESLLPVYCGLLARLHSIDWRILTDDPSTHSTIDSCNIIEHFLIDHQTEVGRIMPPGYQNGWQWILSNGNDIESTGPSIVHGDFHPNNIILRNDVDPVSGGAVVIDWTSAAITDYRFDLAWTLRLCSNSETKIRETIMREYERQSGKKVEDIEFFEVVACFARLLRFGCIMAQNSENIGLRTGTEKILLDQAPVIQQLYERYLKLNRYHNPRNRGIL